MIKIRLKKQFGKCSVVVSKLRRNTTACDEVVGDDNQEVRRILDGKQIDRETVLGDDEGLWKMCRFNGGGYRCVEMSSNP